MPGPSVEEVRAWLGRVMIDRDGNRLGEITDIYLDRETDRPEWAVVRTGLFGLRSSFVPLAEATEAGDHIQVPHERTLVKDAPSIEADGQLSEAEEAELYRHYGLEYDTVSVDSDHAAGQPGGPAADAPPTAPAPETNDGAADTVVAARPTTEDGVGVGEGVSRPFVYETPPGPPQAGPGSRQRQPGQVRLRRYLVTEVVTETESGQRHELQVEREPIDETEAAALVDQAGPAGDPVETVPAEPDGNDWFGPEGGPPR